jgi:hypothetical protein
MQGQIKRCVRVPLTQAALPTLMKTRKAKSGLYFNRMLLSQGVVGNLGLGFTVFLPSLLAVIEAIIEEECRSQHKARPSLTNRLNRMTDLDSGFSTKKRCWKLLNNTHDLEHKMTRKKQGTRPPKLLFVSVSTYIWFRLLCKFDL